MLAGCIAVGTRATMKSHCHTLDSLVLPGTAVYTEAPMCRWSSGTYRERQRVTQRGTERVTQRGTERVRTYVAKSFALSHAGSKQSFPG